ncbi:MAG: hypothetical protein HYY55_04080 [Candidatus Niyogibacteria bacterium]|nr:MAG: hypothetical protein HYY55_04080 [Candidatus Niyogibacteria bacterium]
MSDARRLAVSGSFGISAFYERNLAWLKFPAGVHGSALKIAFETTFLAESNPESRRLLIPPAGYPREMDRYYRGQDGKKMARFYNPAFQGSDVCNIVFSSRFSPDGDFPRKRLVFRRKEAARFGKTHVLPMTMARLGEEKPFGFSLWEEGDPGDRNYVNLAFPGLSGKFEPAFVRIDEALETIFYKIEAEERGVQLHIFVKRVEADDVPLQLGDMIPIEEMTR